MRDSFDLFSCCCSIIIFQYVSSSSEPLQSSIIEVFYTLSKDYGSFDDHQQHQQEIKLKLVFSQSDWSSSGRRQIFSKGFWERPCVVTWANQAVCTLSPWHPWDQTRRRCSLTLYEHNFAISLAMRMWGSDGATSSCQYSFNSLWLSFLKLPLSSIYNLPLIYMVKACWFECFWDCADRSLGQASCTFIEDCLNLVLCCSGVYSKKSVWLSSAAILQDIDSWGIGHINIKGSWTKIASRFASLR